MEGHVVFWKSKQKEQQLFLWGKKEKEKKRGGEGGDNEHRVREDMRN